MAYGTRDPYTATLGSTLKLVDGGTMVSKRKAADLMGKYRIVGLSGRKPTTRTTTKGSKRRFSDLVNRNFHPDTANTVWCGDITYIWVQDEFWYLATVIDAATKQVVGWCFSDRIDARLATDAMISAVTRNSGQITPVFVCLDRILVGAHVNRHQNRGPSTTTNLFY